MLEVEELVVQDVQESLFYAYDVLWGCDFEYYAPL